jgi:hypothetical protein
MFATRQINVLKNLIEGKGMKNHLLLVVIELHLLKKEKFKEIKENI